MASTKQPGQKAKAMTFSGFCWNVVFVSIMLVIIGLSTSGTT